MYKKTNRKIYSKINQELKRIVKDIETDDRFDCLAKTNAFITMKHLKPNFRSNPKRLLINSEKENWQDKQTFPWIY